VVNKIFIYFFGKELILLFSKEALDWCKVTVKAFTLLQKQYKVVFKL